MSQAPSKPQSPAATAAGVALTLAAAAAGRLLGWAFGLQLVVPAVAGLLAATQAKKRFAPEAQPFAAGFGAEAAALTFMLLRLLANSLQYGFHLGPVSVVFWAVELGSFGWLIARPNPAPVALLGALHGYGLVMTLSYLPQLVRSGGLFPIVDTALTVLFSGLAFGLLARGLLAHQRASAAAASGPANG